MSSQRGFRLVGGLTMILMLGVGLVGPASTARVAEAQGDGGLPLLPVALARFGPIVSGGSFIEPLQVSGDWAVYLGGDYGCGHCGPSYETIHVRNVVDNRTFAIRAATLPSGAGDATLGAAGIYFAAPLLIWKQPTTQNVSNDPTAQLAPGDFDCSICYFDANTGLGGAIADHALLDPNMQGAATPLGLDPSGSGRALVRVDLVDASLLYLTNVVAGMSVPLPSSEPLARYVPVVGVVGAQFAAWMTPKSNGLWGLYLYQDSQSPLRNLIDLPDSGFGIQTNGVDLFWGSQNGLNHLDIQAGEVEFIPTPVPNVIVGGNRLAWVDAPGPGGPITLRVEEISPRVSVLERPLVSPAEPGSNAQVSLRGFSGDTLLFGTSEFGPVPGPPQEMRVEFAWVAAPDPQFAQVWNRADGPVAAGQVSRSWLWGPEPRFIGYEAYAEGPNGRHQVYYYDKSRMEVNNPAADPNNPFYVTNGLLVVEMMQGAIQTGNNSFAPWAGPATIAVAGDPRRNNPLTPDYATLARVASLRGENQAPDRTGQPVDDAMDVSGNVSKNSAQGALTSYAQYSGQTGHNIPRVFSDYLAGMQAAYGFDWTFVLGYPITEAYWTQMRVGGQDYPVLIQAYQRRVLTYTPGFEPAWQIQQGNVGLHYREWRYGGNR